MYSRPGLLSKLCLCLLLLIAAGMVSCAAEMNISIPGLGTSDLNSSQMFLQGFDNLTVPPPPVQITDLRKGDSGASNDQQVAPLAFADTGMNTMGSVVLVPITPTPQGSGYSYYNTTGTDPGYLIYESGTYTLQDGFLTDNSSALRIGASNVVLDGNVQTIVGNCTNVGITINSGESNATIRNFAGIRGFYNGIDSFGDRVSITNNSLSDNYNGGINVTGSDLSMSHNTLYNNTGYGIFMEGTGATFTDNTIHDNPVYGLYFYSDNVTLVKNSIYKNGYGVICLGNNTVMSNNNIVNNEMYGVTNIGIRSTITDNLISQNRHNMISIASNSTIIHNTISSSNMESGYGVYSIAENVTISENTVNNNGFGILAVGKNCMATGNKVYANNMQGIAVEGVNGTISDNIIRDTVLYGMIDWGNNSVMLNNIVTNATYGAGIVDVYNSTIIGNQITSASRFGILITDTSEGTGEGTIYNNYFGSQTNIGGSGNFSNYRYIWTNPAGPQRGTNVVGAPFIAGNYWSNNNGTGWSDQQAANVTGFTITPYEVVSGMNDTAPLVSLMPVQINATADNWTNIVPKGNNSYPSYSNQTFITQAKPGADLIDILVNTTSVGVRSNWTFTELVNDSTIQTVGNPTPGQIHTFFTGTPRYGKMPLIVSFSSEQSLGSPTSWYWQFGDGTTNITQNPVHTYEIPGTYTVTLQAINSQTGGYAVWKNYVTVTDGPVPEPTPTPVPGEIIAQFSAYPGSGNAPLTVDFTDMSTGNPISWDWDFGDGTHSSLQNLSHIYTTAGSYSVTLSATNGISSGSLNTPNAVVVT